MKWIIFLVLFPVLSVSAQSPLDRKISDAVKTLGCPEPDERTPVTLNASLIQAADSMAIIIKVKLAGGWHIYDYVPTNLPYISSEFILEMPKSISAVGEWRKSMSNGSAADPGVLIYEEEALFIHKATKVGGLKSNDVIKAGLYYQTCNLIQCLPPVEKIIELKILPPQ